MLKINCKKETERIVKFIQETFKEKGFTKAVLGISGGLDSAVVCVLLVKALGKNNVYGIMLPYGNQKDIDDSKLICKKFEINTSEIGIKSFVDPLTEFINISNIRNGNIMARIRMIVLYDESARLNALVVGTGNKTELQLGYFTLYGDGACALEPIGHLYKTQVRQLAKYLKVPKKIIDKAPSAGLWEDQTDEDELGMTYEEIDLILNDLQKTHRVSYETNNIKNKGKKLNLIASRMRANKFKMELPKCLN